MLYTRFAVGSDDIRCQITVKPVITALESWNILITADIACKLSLSLDVTISYIGVKQYMLANPLVFVTTSLKQSESILPSADTDPF